ncbi:MAG: hypothetical protein JRD89_09080 [Deltaproteobacteria bacterium]|nr:hypothetical protein [Deltaproteobacteria bacterium]
MNNGIYRHPDFDAAVVLERRGGKLLLDFLAKGSSQQRRGGKIVGYTRRNPDRRAMVLHVLQRLGGLDAAYSISRGELTVYLDRTAPHSSKVRQSFSAAGNFRWSLVVALGGLDVPTLGLVPHETHRPTQAIGWEGQF